MYYHIGRDWAGLAATAGPTSQIIVPRSAMPAGSIVPTIRARRPTYFKPMSSADIALLNARRAKTRARLARVLAMPVKQMTTYARSLRGFIPPGVSFGGGVVDPSRTGDLTDAVRNMSGTFSDVLDELRAMGGTAGSLPEIQQQLLGGQSMYQRAGDISAALGLDVTWQDLTSNCSRELGRLSGLSDALPEGILNSDAFAHIAAVFKDQGWGVSRFRDFAQEAGRAYEALTGTININDIIGDAAAFGEGGLRQMVEDMIGRVDMTRPTWLNDANLARVGSAATAWVGAAGSGNTSDYVTAAGTSIVAIGAVVPQPAGIIVSAVGALISLIGVLLGDEDPPLPPPELESCTGKNDSNNVAWAYNPEAWTALALWVVAKEGYRDSPTYKYAKSHGKLVQEVISNLSSDFGGWWCTIDRYTGEVMVREPTGSGEIAGVNKPLRRLLDMIDRKVLNLRETPGFLDEAKVEFGCVPRDTHWGGRNFLYCYPNPNETFTRFFGTSTYYSNPDIKGFRKDWSGGGQAPEHIGGQLGWDILGNDAFWRGYRHTLVASVYLGGTVPYGVRMLPRERGRGFMMALYSGVGGAIVYVREDEAVLTCTEPPCRARGSMNHTIGIQDFERWVADESGSMTGLSRILRGIPLPSPDVQISPTNVVRRPDSPRLRCSVDGRICAAPLASKTMMLLPPGGVLKRDGLVGSSPAGMSTGAKVALGAAGLALLGGGGYYLWQRNKDRGR